MKQSILCRKTEDESMYEAFVHRLLWIDGLVVAAFLVTGCNFHLEGDSDREDDENVSQTLQGSEQTGDDGYGDDWKSNLFDDSDMQTPASTSPAPLLEPTSSSTTIP